MYGDDPLAVALSWRVTGAELLHVVDLDGARQGQPVQLEAIRQIASTAPVQVGGGLRTEDDVARALEVAQRVVLGTAALDRALIAALARIYGDRLVVALDTRSGMVAVQGWTEASGRTLLDLAGELLDLGVRRFLHTDVERDGAMTSPNYTSLEALIRLGAPVIASGGVASLDDVRRLRAIGAEAVIIGRALYEGTIDLQEAMKLAH